MSRKAAVYNQNMLPPHSSDTSLHPTSPTDPAATPRRPCACFLVAALLFWLFVWPVVCIWFFCLVAWALLW